MRMRCCRHCGLLFAACRRGVVDRAPGARALRWLAPLIAAIVVCLAAEGVVAQAPAAPPDEERIRDLIADDIRLRLAALGNDTLGPDLPEGPLIETVTKRPGGAQLLAVRFLRSWHAPQYLLVRRAPALARAAGFLSPDVAVVWGALREPSVGSMEELVRHARDVGRVCNAMGTAMWAPEGDSAASRRLGEPPVPPSLRAVDNTARGLPDGRVLVRVTTPEFLPGSAGGWVWVVWVFLVRSSGDLDAWFRYTARDASRGCGAGCEP